MTFESLKIIRKSYEHLVNCALERRFSNWIEVSKL